MCGLDIKRVLNGVFTVKSIIRDAQFLPFAKLDMLSARHCTLVQLSTYLVLAHVMNL